MERKREFLLIKQHTDQEITYFLQRQADNGWWLSASKGNWFVFDKKRVPNSRVMCLSVKAPDLGGGAEETIRKEYEEYRKKGWDVFVKGELENLRDSQRHVFLYSTDKNAKIIPSDEKKMKLVWLSGFIRAMANWAISMIYLSFILFLLTIYGKGLLFWYGVVIALCTALLFFTSAVSFFISLAMKKNPKKYMENGGYRLLDYGTRLATLVLILMAILLVLDSAFRGF